MGRNLAYRGLDENIAQLKIKTTGSTGGFDFYVVSIPDFQIGTQGETLAEAMEMARDAIGMCGCYRCR